MWPSELRVQNLESLYRGRPSIIQVEDKSNPKKALTYLISPPHRVAHRMYLVKVRVTYFQAFLFFSDSISEKDVANAKKNVNTPHWYRYRRNTPDIAQQGAMLVAASNRGGHYYQDRLKELRPLMNALAKEEKSWDDKTSNKLDPLRKALLIKFLKEHFLKKITVNNTLEQ